MYKNYFCRNKLPIIFLNLLCNFAFLMPKHMQHKILFFLFLIITLNSCQNESNERRIQYKKEVEKQEVIFENISKAWHFSYPSLNSQTQTDITNWNEWRLLQNELSQKPKSSIGAFQKKAKSLSKRAKDLNANIPQKFNKPEIKSRIAVLSIKLNSINLYINLHQIPDNKVVALIKDVNVEINSLSQQLDEIVRKNNIPLEEGESDMIKMLDTTRAIPSN